MKDTKRVFEVYSFLDYDGYARRFGKMAEKGWLIECVEPFFFVYRRIEPKKLTFFISYFPRASELDPEPGRAQSEFIEFCESTGWKLAMRTAQMQVFYNERENPVPIETDPALEVETIHKAAKRSYLPGHFAILVMASLLESVQLRDAIREPLDTLANATALIVIFALALLILLSVVELSAYFIWHHRARRAAKERGVLIPSVSHRGIQLAVTALTFASALVWLGYILLGQDRQSRVIIMIYIPAWALAIYVVNLVKKGMKRAGASKGANLAAIIITSTVLAVVVVSVHLGVAVKLRLEGKLEDKTPELPLTLADLDSAVSGMSEASRHDELSPIMSRTYARHYLTSDDGTDLKFLYYTVYEVKLPFLTPLIRDLARGYVDGGGEEDVYSSPGLYLPVDPAPWSADAAYRRMYELSPGDSWMLFYGSRIIFITPDDEPTQEQMDIIAEKLGGVKGE